MKLTKKPLIIGGLTLGIAGGAFLFQGTDLMKEVQASTADQSKLIEEASLSEAEVTKIATEEVPGEVADMEVEKEDGTIVYEFEIQTDADSAEVEVDGNSGEILGSEATEENEEDDEIEENEENETEASQSELIEKAKLTEKEAEKIATDETGGEIISLEVEQENETVVFEFAVKTDAGTKEVKVDGESGEILNVENDDQDTNESEENGE